MSNYRNYMFVIAFLVLCEVFIYGQRTLESTMNPSGSLAMKLAIAVVLNPCIKAICSWESSRKGALGYEA